MVLDVKWNEGILRYIVDNPSMLDNEYHRFTGAIHSATQIETWDTSWSMLLRNRSELFDIT